MAFYRAFVGTHRGEGARWFDSFVMWTCARSEEGGGATAGMPGRDLRALACLRVCVWPNVRSGLGAHGTVDRRHSGDEKISLI